MLPADLPPYPAVQALLTEWCVAGLWRDIETMLRRLVWFPSILHDAREVVQEREKWRRHLFRVATDRPLPASVDTAAPGGATLENPQLP